MFILLIKLLSHSFVSFKVNCMLWNSHFLNTKSSKLFILRDFSLVVEIWFKVMEIHWSKCVRTLIL